MTDKYRLRLVLHGAIVLLVGLLSGLPTVVETFGGETERYWHTAHEALIMMGVWMLAMASVLPALVLERRQTAAQFWALLLMGYGFVVALGLGGAIGVSPFAPGHTLGASVAFVFAVIGILGAVTSAALTVMGARAALRVQK